MTSGVDYKDIMWAELKVDVYAGDNCDKHQKYWETSCDGDMESETERKPLKLNIRSFPPGTKVVVSVPCCPECGLPADEKDKEVCNFDWKDWVEGEYS